MTQIHETADKYQRLRRIIATLSEDWDVVGLMVYRNLSEEDAELAVQIREEIRG